MRNFLIVASTVCVMFSASSWAEKPEHAGKGQDKDWKSEKMLDKNHRREDMTGHQEGHELDEKKHKHDKQVMKDAHKDDHDRLEDEKHGMEKQREKKAEQVRNELDKGSEQGQQQRDANSKKWWKFWGE